MKHARLLKGNTGLTPPYGCNAIKNVNIYITVKTIIDTLERVGFMKVVFNSHLNILGKETYVRNI